MRVTSQMLAQTQLKAGLDTSSKTLLDYIQDDDDDSLSSLLTKSTDLTSSSLTKKLQKDAYEDIEESADSLTDAASVFTSEDSNLFAEAEKTGDYSGIYSDIKSLVNSYNALHNSLGETTSTLNSTCEDILEEAVSENSELLSSVGIALKDSGLLSLDESKLETADKETLEEAFGTSSEIAKRLTSIGENISSLAKANINYVTNSYTSSGTSSNSSDDLYSLLTSKFNSYG